MMYFIEGLPKMGKSYELLRITIQFLSEGRDVATTMTLNIEGIYSILTKKQKPETIGRLFKIQKLDDVENFTHGVIIIDEASAFIHARDWAHMTPATRSKFSQHMHDSLDVWLAAQEFETVDPIARGLVAFCFRIDPYSIFWWKGYQVLQFTPSTRKVNRREPIHNTKHFFKKQLFALYNYKELERSGKHEMPLMQDFVVKNQITFGV